MKSLSVYLSILLACFMATSCEDKIELDLPEGDRLLVVEGWLSNEPGPHYVKLTYTQAYFDASAPPVASGAAVSLLDDAGLEVLLEEFEPGLYSYPDSGIVGNTYELDIRLSDGSHFRSKPELLRVPVPILEIYWDIDPNGPSEFLEQDPEQIYRVLIDTFEPPGLGDNYRWRTYVNGVFKNDPFDIFVTNDDFVDGNAIIGFSPVNDLFFLGDSVTVVQERISRQAREFLELVQSQTAFVGSPFDLPPAPIKGNVRNVNRDEPDALGYFGVAARDRRSVIVGVD